MYALCEHNVFISATESQSILFQNNEITAIIIMQQNETLFIFVQKTHTKHTPKA